MLVLSRQLSLEAVARPHADSPLLGWHTVVTASNVAATSEDADYPASNLANPATHLKWTAGETSPTTQYVTVTTGYADDIDYVGIARHNLGSEGLTVSVQGFQDPSWVELIEQRILADDGPTIFRFTPGVYSQVRLVIEGIDESSPPALPSIAVLFVGKLIVMERRIWVGHTPLDHARKTRVVNSRSESGNYLGSVVLSQHAESSAMFQLIDPDWYRENLDEFLSEGKGTTFFFAWRPTTYPNEVGYAWLTNDPMPKPVTPSHLLEVELQMQGIV